MIELSSRHALPMAVVMWLLAIPIAYHSIVQPEQDDCANPSSLKLARFVPVPDANSIATVERPADGTEALVGDLETQGKWKIDPKWTIARRHDLAQSYFAPPGLISRVSPEDRESIVVREAGGLELPIHLRVDNSPKGANTVAYLYVFGGRPTRFPLVASVREAFGQLLEGSLPLTVLLTEGDTLNYYKEANERILVDWIASAWLRYEEVCGP